MDKTRTSQAGATVSNITYRLTSSYKGWHFLWDTALSLQLPSCLIKPFYIIYFRDIQNKTITSKVPDPNKWPKTLHCLNSSQTLCYCVDCRAEARSCVHSVIAQHYSVTLGNLLLIGQRRALWEDVVNSHSLSQCLLLTFLEPMSAVEWGQNEGRIPSGTQHGERAI